MAKFVRFVVQRTIIITSIVWFFMMISLIVLHEQLLFDTERDRIRNGQYNFDAHEPIDPETDEILQHQIKSFLEYKDSLTDNSNHQLAIKLGKVEENYLIHSFKKILKKKMPDRIIQADEVNKTVLKKSESKENYGNEKVKNIIARVNDSAKMDRVNAFLAKLNKSVVRGMGENGLPVTITRESLTAEEQEKYDIGWKNNAYNEYVSDIISVHRTLPDIRYEKCSRDFPADLPDTSVIICFHNEGWSVLLRTVHSVLDRSPPQMVKDVILVDDYSDMEHLMEPLEIYMADFEKVKIVRTKKREGLIRSRLLGNSVATGQILTFLDSHVECYPGWLEPLLSRVAANWSTVVCPVINLIDDNTFQTNNLQAEVFGVFSVTNLVFGWEAIPPREMEKRQNIWDPIRSPAMAGGLFSMSKRYFEHLGTYDDGMEIWGGENIEMSIRVWTCGGTIEIHPCSHVGHVFRSRSPYKWQKSVYETLLRNKARIAEVWLDEYKHIYYERINYSHSDYGDVSDRLELKRKLKCKSFDWYLQNVHPEMKIPEPTVIAGDVQSASKSQLCLDTMGVNDGLESGVTECHGTGNNQYWAITEKRHIYGSAENFKCLTYNVGRGKLAIYQCTDNSDTWQYGEDKTIRHEASGQCIELVPSIRKLVMKPCTGADVQIWEWRAVKRS